MIWWFSYTKHTTNGIIRDDLQYVRKRSRHISRQDHFYQAVIPHKGHVLMTSLRYAGFTLDSSCYTSADVASHCLFVCFATCAHYLDKRDMHYIIPTHVIDSFSVTCALQARFKLNKDPTSAIRKCNLSSLLQKIICVRNNMCPVI